MDGINSYFVSWAARQSGLKVALCVRTRRRRDLRRIQHIPFDSASSLCGGFGPESTVPLLGSVAEKVSNLISNKDAHRKMAALWQDPNVFPHPYFYTRLLFTPAQVHGLMSSNGVGPADPWIQWLTQTAEGSEQLDDFTAVSCLESAPTWSIPCCVIPTP